MSERTTLAGKTVLVIGGTKYLGLRIAAELDGIGAHVVVSGRDGDQAHAAAATLSNARGLRLDVTDENDIIAAAAELATVDHVVVTAAAPHNVPVGELDRAAVTRAFDAKVIGPLLVAKHFAPRITPGGSLLLFSGVAAWTPSPGYAVMGVTNGAVAFTVSHLARELAPVRVNAIAPGIVDSGKYDAMAVEDRQAFFDASAAKTLAGRVGSADDVVDAVMWLLAAGFVSGETIHVDGGARHV